MKPSTLLLVLVPLCGACVTPGDLHRVALSVDDLARDLEDESKTVDELADSAKATAAEIRDVAEAAIDRAQDGLTLAEGGGIAGAIAAAAAVALNAYRNQTRAREIAKIPPKGS